MTSVRLTKLKGADTMLNKKGYTLIEMTIVLAISSLLFISVFYFPTQLIRVNSEHNDIAERVNDNHTLRKALTTDLNNEYVEQLDENTLMIGSKTYTFLDEVKRESTTITSKPYNFDLDGNVLIIYNDESTLEFTVGSSLSKGLGDDNE